LKKKSFKGKTMNFLTEDTQELKTEKKYFKFAEGENRVRILSAPIAGWEDWIDNKPVRYRAKEKPSKAHDSEKKVRAFWSVIIWNYSEKKVQIMHITQASIRKSIEALCIDEDWGSPFHYDLKIIKSGEGIDTEYRVNPGQKKPVDELIKHSFKETPIALEALFDNADPFSSDHIFITRAFWEEEQQEEQPF